MDNDMQELAETDDLDQESQTYEDLRQAIIRRKDRIRNRQVPKIGGDPMDLDPLKDAEVWGGRWPL